MGLVSIEQWRAERGWGGSPQAEAADLPPPSAEGPETHAARLLDQVAALEQEIARQADLIVKLQAALRSYVEKEEALRVQVIRKAHAGPKKARVLRVPRRLGAASGPAPTDPPPLKSA